MCVAGRLSWLQVIFYFFWKVHTKKLKLDLWISQAYSREKLKYFCKLDLSYVAFESDKLLGDQSVRNKEFHGIYGWTQDFVLGELQICIVSCGLSCRYMNIKGTVVLLIQILRYKKLGVYCPAIHRNIFCINWMAKRCCW